MFALAWIRVFIEMGSVELGQSISILREMSGDPVEDDPDPGLMTPVGELAEFVRIDVPSWGRVIVDYLITPRTIERVLGARHQLDVSVAHFQHVLDQSIRKFSVTQVTVILFRDARPGAEMNLIDTHRFFMPFAGPAALHPFPIRPREPVQIEDQGGGLQTMLAIEGERVTFQNDLPKTISQFKLVMGFFANPGDQHFPDPILDSFARGTDPAIPAVEIANHGCPLS